METMEHVVCSFRLQELPVHVIASHIMPMVDFKELVALDSTGAMTIGGVLQEARDLMPPIKLPHNLSRSVGIWLLEHGYSLKDCVLPSLVIDGAADLAAVMEQYTKQLHDVHLDLPNRSVESPALISRVSKLSISHSLTCKQVEELCMNTCNVVELSVSSVAETANPELLSQLLRGVPKLKKLWCGFKNLSTTLPALRPTWAVS
jgi:PIN domain nuclease of toxin-antitoxin system